MGLGALTHRPRNGLPTRAGATAAVVPPRTGPAAAGGRPAAGRLVVSAAALGTGFIAQITEMRALPDSEGCSILVSFEFRKGT